LKCQRDWLYLEPIFSSGDIGATLPLEAKYFADVDTHWKNSMNAIKEDPCIVEFSDREGIVG
jgi:dynein heavy chain